MTCKVPFTARLDCRIAAAIRTDARKNKTSITAVLEKISSAYYGKTLPGVCPDCGKWNHFENKFCSECGKELKQ